MGLIASFESDIIKTAHFFNLRNMFAPSSLYQSKVSSIQSSMMPPTSNSHLSKKVTYVWSSSVISATNPPSRAKASPPSFFKYSVAGFYYSIFSGILSHGGEHIIFTFMSRAKSLLIEYKC